MIHDIIRLWGIDIEINNEYIPSVLLERYPSKCRFIDYLPKTISEKYAYKFDQVEKEIYNITYHRIYNCILKLWMYDDVYYESKLLQSRNNIFKKKLTNRIENASHLKKLLKLSQKNKIDLTLVFKELQLVIIPSWSSFFVFIQDENKFYFLDDILRTEGLHLRK